MNFKKISKFLFFLIFVIPMVGCTSERGNNTISNLTPIKYIDDESNVFYNKKITFFRDDNTFMLSDSNEIAKIIVNNVKQNPRLEIRITYKLESDLANNVASKVQKQVPNQIYISSCCKLDAGRVNLPSNRVEVSYYK